MEENQELTENEEKLDALDEKAAQLMRLMDEKAEALLSGIREREQAADERQAEVGRKEKELEIREALANHNLPERLAEYLSVPDDKDTEEVIGALEEIMRTEARRRVAEKLTGETPKTGEVKRESDMTDAEYYRMTYGMER